MPLTLPLSYQTGLRLAWGARPYFSTDSPAHDSVFYAFPGQRFALPAVTILDPDENGNEQHLLERRSVFSAHSDVTLLPGVFTRASTDNVFNRY